ncbi:GGDEF domain-containing protein [Hoeflea ulvae]|uniref:diguanylate cyclase n=1 Tax=Hoeflea ulvae TaxID=2983764 RepID=A0ABT3YE13_9HYPH|nr:GGDEF domain-containing protein [Hoeflea ulvae]MCY0094133.1 GGDEF domain-containing protein [Hoeflea ulvae]
MNKQKTAATSIGLRIATTMYQMGIDGLPRNYELLYEAYSGSNPELTKEFLAIGKKKSQRALDELGKKFLPHHHEETLVSKTNARMQVQMTTFMNLLEQEKSSLSDYGTMIDEASRGFASQTEPDPATLTRSVRKLNQATELQVSKSAALVAVAAQQAAALEDIGSDIANFEKMKFVDPLTGLANRRAFNRAVVRIYATPALPMMCGLAYAEIDDFKRLSELGKSDIGSHFIQHVGKLLHAGNTTHEFVAHLDGNRFAFLIRSAQESEIMRLVDGLRTAVASKPLVHPQKLRVIGNATLSIGVAMSTVANDAGKLLAYAEKAMTASIKGGGNRATLYTNAVPANANKGWIIYQPE